MRGFYDLFLGKFDSVEEWLRRCDKIAHDKDELEALAWTASVRSWLATVLGDGQRALSHARQALELVERSGSSLARVIAFTVHGMALLESRECREAQATGGFSQSPEALGDQARGTVVTFHDESL